MMDNNKVEEILQTIDDLGYHGMLGLLRARMHGLITQDELESCKEYAHTVAGIPRDWWKFRVLKS